MAQHSSLWMLPDGVEEWLPETAWALEILRGRLLSSYRDKGFELVIPPPVEHLDALLTGAGGELEAQTFKFTDPVSGRLLGLRADMTPQAARIAARHFGNDDIVRLCYIGSVLRARADEPGGARAQMQVGCEVFGDTSLDADIEVLALMLTTLELGGVADVHVGLSHAAIYRALFDRAELGGDARVALFDILQRKSAPDLAEFMAARKIDPAGIEALLALHGSESILDRAREQLGGISGAVDAALEDLAHVVATLEKRYPQVGLHVDLAELRGYGYHTGMVFSAFASGHGSELARGGRYDGAGGEFGLARPATGFSADINQLLRLGRTAFS